MLTFRSILRHLCRFFKNLTEKVGKRLYRSSAVFMAGAAIITVLAFTPAAFGSEGSNARGAFAKTPAPAAAAAAGDDSVTEAKVLTKQNIQQENGQIPEAGSNYNQLVLTAGFQGIGTGEADFQKAALNLKLRETVNRAEAMLADEREGAASQPEAETAQAADLLAVSGSGEAEPEAAGPEAAESQVEAAGPGESLQAGDEDQAAGEEAALAEQTDSAVNAGAMPISNDDYQVLLKIVQAEAGICDEEGRILVANVVLNRVRSSRFPDSVRSVVYAPSQFSPVSNGSINSVKVTDTTRQCVDRALAGEDYSKGALYFMNRGGARGRAVSWFDSHLTYLFSHDGHEFFK